MSRPGVLNTRVRDQGPELSQLLEQAGFEALDAPTIEIVPAWDEAELAAVRQDLRAGAFAWLVLPSLNAGRGLDPELLNRNVRVVCGVATGRALGLTPHIALARFSASAALEALRAVVRPGARVLVPRAADGRDELIEGLRALGAEVSAPIAYRTAAVEPAALETAMAWLRAGRVSAVSLCSPSAVAGLLQVATIDDLRGCAVVCLGETTAAAARQAGVRVDRVAEQTNMPSLVAAVKAALDARAQPPAPPAPPPPAAPSAPSAPPAPDAPAPVGSASPPAAGADDSLGLGEAAAVLA